MVYIHTEILATYSIDTLLFLDLKQPVISSLNTDLFFIMQCTKLVAMVAILCSFIKETVLAHNGQIKWVNSHNVHYIGPSLFCCAAIWELYSDLFICKQYK